MLEVFKSCECSFPRTSAALPLVAEIRTPRRLQHRGVNRKEVNGTVITLKVTNRCPERVRVEIAVEEDGSVTITVLSEEG